VLSAPGTKFGPPASGVVSVRHPRLPALVRRAATRPLVTVTAGPGWGRTTFAAQWAAENGASWCTLDGADRDPVQLAATLVAAHPGTPEVALTDADTQALADRVAAGWDVGGPVRIVLDDAEVLLGTRALQLLQRLLATAGPGTQLIVVSREPLGLVDPRDRAQARALELDATHLAFDTERVLELLDAELVPDRPLAARLVDATAGWPAAVRLLVEALHDVDESERSGQLTHLATPEGPVGRYLRELVLPALGEGDLRHLTQLALLGTSDASELAAVLGVEPTTAAELVRDLVQQGSARLDPAGRVTDVAVVPVLRRALLEHHLAVRPDREALVRDVVAGLRSVGAAGRALAVLTRAGHGEAAAALLEEHGEDLLHGGHLDTVVAAADALSPAQRTPAIDRLHGRALGYRGEWAAALRCLEAAGAGTEDGTEHGTTSGMEDVHAAFGVGMVHHLRGDLDAAVEAYARGPEDGDTAEVAALLAWRSTAHWLRGEGDEARRFAVAAMAAASAAAGSAGEGAGAPPAVDRALALAHTAAAMVAATEGDRRANETHYAHALAAARRAGDELQQARILTNQGSRHLESGAYDVALHATDEAIDLAEAQGFAMIVGVARCNRAEILLRTGRLDEAAADAEAARGTFARIGSSLESYAHHLLGDIRREQGDLTLARVAYERALRLSGPAGDRQGQVPALLGLARTLVGTDPDAAAEAAGRALALDDGMATVSAQLACAWIALAAGENDRAADGASAALDLAVTREDRAGVAEARTLLAVLDDDPVPALREAARLWWEVGARLSATRAELGVARRLPGSRGEVTALERRLAAWGCSPDGGPFAHRVVSGFGLRSRLAIRVLGAFVVERDGRPVPRSEWGSRKARELLKVLVVRAGRSAAREELAELLWPGEPYDAVANRLSVALSVVRSILAGDDRGTGALRTDDTCVALDPERVDVDLHRFRQLAEEGLRRARTSDRDRALELLLAAEEAYAGDLLEDDRDELWLVDRREELRTLYVSVARTSAALVGEEDPDRAMRLLLRVLDRDAYDEPAHLGVCRALLRSGRHGEARRRHRLYAERMAELDLPAVPLHDLGSPAEQPADRPAVDLHHGRER
jgi:ATP/maltotriose-dependent transcriptional regulator MalT/DNA-binding SARP family transcriptional activator